MERRKFVVGLGALASGSAAAVGTGAFNFANVERSISIDTAGDDSAFIALESESEYTNNVEDRLAFDFVTDEGGSGINEDSDYSFTGIFSIENQGTDSVGVWINDNDSTNGDNEVVSWFGADSATNTAFEESDSIEGSGNPYAIDPGEKVYVNLMVLLRPDSSTIDDLPDEINVVADRSQGN